MKHTKGLVRLGFAILFLLTPFFLAAVKTEQRKENPNDPASLEKWEYLVVANPNRANYSPTDNPSMRKEESGSFGHEAFVLEQHLDRMGAKGWELVEVSGTPNDPVYYFKRAKRVRY